ALCAGALPPLRPGLGPRRTLALGGPLRLRRALLLLPGLSRFRALGRRPVARRCVPGGAGARAFDAERLADLGDRDSEVSEARRNDATAIGEQGSEQLLGRRVLPVGRRARLVECPPGPGAERDLRRFHRRAPPLRAALLQALAQLLRGGAEGAQDGPEGGVRALHQGEQQVF